VEYSDGSVLAPWRKLGVEIEAGVAEVMDDRAEAVAVPVWACPLCGLDHQHDKFTITSTSQSSLPTHYQS
jgi:hypothetical protein